MLPGINFGGGGSGGFDFGDFAGGDIRTGPLNIDARTTTGGGDPELIGQAFPLVLLVVGAIVAIKLLKK